MKLTQPIRDIVELDKIKKYYCDIKPNKRNFWKERKFMWGDGTIYFSRSEIRK